MIEMPAGILPRDVETYLSRLSWGGSDTVGGFLWTTRSEYDAGALHISRWYADYVREPLYRASRVAGLEEDDEIAKLVCWRQHGLGQLAQYGDEETRDQAQADALRPHFRQIARDRVAAMRETGPASLRAIINATKVPINHSKGWPGFWTGAKREVALALTALVLSILSGSDFSAAATWGRLIRLLQRFAPRRLPDPLTTCATRIQGGSSPVPWFGEVDGVLTHMGERRGPKVRKIAIGPFVFNLLLVPLCAVLLHTRKATPGRVGTVDEAWGHRLAFKFAKSFDFKTFDDTIALESRAAWRTDVVRPVLRAGISMGLWSRGYAAIAERIIESYETMDTILPPLSRHTAFRVCTVVGRNRSGERDTTELASDHAYAAWRFAVDRRMPGLRVVFSNLGDDITVHCDTAIPDDLAEYLPPTFKCVPANAPVHLRRFLIPEFGAACMEWTRAALGTWQKEKRSEPRSEIQMAVGIAQRIDNLRGHPAASEYARMLRALPSHDDRAQRAVALATQLPRGDLLRTFATWASQLSSDFVALDPYAVDSAEWLDYIDSITSAQPFLPEYGLPANPPLTSLITAARTHFTPDDACRVLEAASSDATKLHFMTEGR